jgi:alpha-ketoglutarate-dependent taurine dioxygenase
MSQLQFQPLTPAFGAEVIGLDPELALTDGETQRTLQRLFDERGILVFRDLDIDERTQADLARMLIRMGPLGPGETPSGRPDGETFYVSNKEPGGGAPFGRLLFHSDTMWSEQPWQILTLYGLEVEPPVAPTLFASPVHAWETLPDTLRARVEGRFATHGHEERYMEREADDPDVLRPNFNEAKTITQPVALVHPRTGKTILYVSQQITRCIEGMSAEESEELLEELFAHLYRPELLYQHEWRNHDWAAWDNIAVQHARPNVEKEGHVRTLRKVYAPASLPSDMTAKPTYVG